MIFYPILESKKVTIPVIIRDGKLEYFYGGSLPEFEGSYIGDLVLPESSIKDKEFLNMLQKEVEAEILPENTKLYIVMNPMSYEHVDNKYVLKANSIKTLNYEFSGKILVALILIEPLRILTRGTKKAILLPTKCFIPSLELVFESLNTAYTKISEKYEPNRRTHSGNVFDKCLYHSYDEDIWLSIDYLRGSEEAKYEYSLILDNRRFIINHGLNGKQLNTNEKKVMGAFNGKSTIKGEEIREILNELGIKDLHSIYNLIKMGVIEVK